MGRRGQHITYAFSSQTSWNTDYSRKELGADLPKINGAGNKRDSDAKKSCYSNFWLLSASDMSKN